MLERVEIEADTRRELSLLHRAGYAVAQEALAWRGHNVIPAGSNNGGDGWVAAEALRSVKLQR